MRILVVEDDTETAHYIRRGLTELGCQVDVASDGKSGLLMAAAEEYDVAILDRMLPGPDGIAIVESLRKIGNETPILFLSALGSVEERVRACAPAPTTISPSHLPSPSFTPGSRHWRAAACRTWPKQCSVSTTWRWT